MSAHLLPGTASTQAFIGGDFVDAASGATFASLTQRDRAGHRARRCRRLASAKCVG
jgi:hypothetical protein